MEPSITSYIPQNQALARLRHRSHKNFFNAESNHNTIKKCEYIPSVVRRTPSTKLNPDHDKSGETTPAQQVQNERELGQYLALARNLGADVVHVRELVRSLEQLLVEEARVTQDRARVHEKLNSAEDPAILKEDLAKVESDLSFMHARISAKQRSITQAENQLHDLLPKARETAQRLFLAFTNHTYAHACEQMRDLIHPTAQEACQEQINELALSSSEVVEAKLLNPPSIPFLVLDELEPNNYRPFPTQRKDKMLLITQIAEELSDKMIQILDRVESLEGFASPPFLLGAEAPQTETPLSWQIPLRSTSQDVELEDFVYQGKDSLLTAHMEEMLREAGKTREDLTQAFYDVLKHSEKLSRQGVRQGIAFDSPIAQH
jgi:hypothetical protein